VARPKAGTVVVVRFPFSDLSSSKLRPALVLAALERGDFILSQITSNPFSDPNAVRLEEEDFEVGSLSRVSYVRPGKLFTANAGIVEGSVGRVNKKFHKRVFKEVMSLLEVE
jgi:mRNA interferase MazF